MLKHIIRVAIVGVCTLSTLPAIITINFFTNEDLNQGNTQIATIACKYEEKILEEVEIQEEKTITANVATEKTSLQEAKQVSKPKENKKEESAVKTVKKENNTEKNAKEVQNTKEQVQNTIATQYKGFSTIGKIEIPRTGLSIPILSKVTVKGMEVAPCVLYSTGTLNKNGNNLIVGHNYRNGSIFSNNKKLQIGDKIYVTSLDGKRLEYTIYNKFVVDSEEVDYFMKESAKPEITLSTCTDNEEQRLIVVARTNS